MRALLLAACLACGCASYERDVGGRTFFSGLDGASTPEASGSSPRGYVDPRGPRDIRTRIVHDDGTVTLRALSARHLMVHVFQTLRDEERELFLGQVLSDATKREYARNGVPPERAYDDLRERLPDIDALFARMPLGEYTPNTRVDPVGGGVQRVRLIGGAGRDLAWQGFDMIMEGGNQRLLWFYQDRR